MPYKILSWDDLLKVSPIKNDYIYIKQQYRTSPIMKCLLIMIALSR